MTHYSNTCVLLRWNPPLITAFSGSNVKKLGYKVYVNGVSEGMVCTCMSNLFVSKRGVHSVMLCLYTDYMAASGCMLVYIMQVCIMQCLRLKCHEMPACEQACIQHCS